MVATNGNSSPRAAHVIILPIPILGRTNPMLQFAKRLSSKGLTVTIASTTTFAAKLLASSGSSHSVSIAAISDDSDKSRWVDNSTSSLNEMIDRFGSAVARGLADLVDAQAARGAPVRCLVYDSSFPWALGLARKLGIYGAPFFPQSCAAALIFCHVYRGVVESPAPAGGVSPPGLPEMEFRDLPTLMREVGKNPMVEKLAANQFENFFEADWQFMNSFDVLEDEVKNWMAKRWPSIRTIGPSIPSMHLDKRIKDDNEYGISPINPETNACIQWLDNQKACSTIYVSFGSLAALEGPQMEEMASALKNSDKPFLWVVKAAEEDKLPPGFKQEVSEKGMIVGWGPQLAVLEHRAVGCFFTHCGWNSTLEAISMGVPLVAMPLWADQPTNAKFVEDVWRVGVRVKGDGVEIVKRDEIERCIREVMEGERGKDVRMNAIKWKRSAIEAMQEGGSSDRNIDEFVSKISQT